MQQFVHPLNSGREDIAYEHWNVKQLDFQLGQVHPRSFFHPHEINPSIVFGHSNSV